MIDDRSTKHANDFPTWLSLWGGPGGCDYLDENGDVWDWNGFDGSVQQNPDGPRKVGAIAIACQTIPELTPWLPSRSASATDCELCQKTGWIRLQPPNCDLLCMKCHGMGWLSE